MKEESEFVFVVDPAGSINLPFPLSPQGIVQSFASQWQRNLIRCPARVNTDLLGFFQLGKT
jgi:hypothetical protein